VNEIRLRLLAAHNTAKGSLVGGTGTFSALPGMPLAYLTLDPLPFQYKLMPQALCCHDANAHNQHCQVSQLSKTRTIQLFFTTNHWHRDVFNVFNL